MERFEVIEFSVTFNTKCNSFFVFNFVLTFFNPWFKKYANNPWTSLHISYGSLYEIVKALQELATNVCVTVWV